MADTHLRAIRLFFIAFYLNSNYIVSILFRKSGQCCGMWAPATYCKELSYLLGYFWVYFWFFSFNICLRFVDFCDCILLFYLLWHLVRRECTCHIPWECSRVRPHCNGLCSRCSRTQKVQDVQDVQGLKSGSSAKIAWQRASRREIWKWLPCGSLDMI